VSGGITVVVTRPGAAGQALVAELTRRGRPALWLPAFEFGPPPDEARTRAVLASLADFDLAVFVSPQAARATAALLAGPWPAGTAIAAVGAGTRAAVLAAIAGSERARLLPARDEELEGSGSEALWPLLQAMQPLPRRVLLLRAQSGREWLADKLQAAGSAVTPLAVYSRQPCAPSAELRARLAAAAAAGGLASVISSSDAVDALADGLGGQPAVLQALRAGPALASHPRIAERLRAAGFARVALCAPDADAIIASLREGGV
jgi:uroporphyrinogen-III synthase